MVQLTVGCLKTNTSTKHVVERVMANMYRYQNLSDNAHTVSLLAEGRKITIHYLSFYCDRFLYSTVTQFCYKLIP